MRGNTFRKESFVCSFDADGQFYIFLCGKSRAGEV